MNLCARELESIKIVGNCSVSFSKYGICPQPGSTVSIAFKEELSSGNGSISGELHVCYAADGTCTTCAAAAATALAQPKKVAIIGLGIFFPAGCEDLDTYWEFLVQGKCAIREPKPERCITRSDLKVKAGFTDDVGGFDAQFFKMSPLEASQLDPQQFHLLECTWEALEDAGYKPGDLVNSPTAVMIGCGFGEHLSQAVSDSDHMSRFSPTTIIPCMIANRVSYCYGFRGPSITIDTACAGALTAVHYACNVLQLGSASLAIAGGTNFLTESNFFIAIKQAHMNSPTGESRPFDKDANGYVRAEGAGAAVLKLYEDAVRDGDRIHAVIVGSEASHNGKTGLAFTTPSTEAQAELCHTVAARCGVDPAAVRYVEAHGTGTSVGDPLEADAIYQVFSQAPHRTMPFSTGSVKGNLGHMEAASGMGSMVKAILMMQHRTLVPSIGIRTLNPKVKCKIQQEVESIADVKKLYMGVN